MMRDTAEAESFNSNQTWCRSSILVTTPSNILEVAELHKLHSIYNDIIHGLKGSRGRMKNFGINIIECARINYYRI
jgi:hypothetical protein